MLLVCFVFCFFQKKKWFAQTLAANEMTYTFVHWQHDNLQFASYRSNISHYRFLDWFIESGYMNKKRKRRLEVTSYTICFFVWNWKSPHSKSNLHRGAKNSSSCSMAVDWVETGLGLAHWGPDPWFIGIAMVNVCIIYFVSPLRSLQVFFLYT